MATRPRHVLVRRLARGGMGEVHLAVSSGLGGARKLVVVKQVLEALADDPAFAEMFLNEARLAAGLDHPHIVRVYDVCEIDGRPSLVMEYVHGEGLGALLQLAVTRSTTIPLASALTVVHAVAGALDHAHRACAIDGTPLGIVHRDVAPNNILLGYAGEVKLIDFGVARAMAATRITRTGTIKGKAAYMAPEQFTDGAIDARTDVFSLGAVLYEATTLRRAFRADNEVATLNRIATGDLVRPTDACPGYPRRLEEVVMTALAVDPAARFGSAGEMREAIAEVARELGVGLSLEEIGPLVARLAGERQPPRVDLAISTMVRLRRLRRARGIAIAFGAGAVVAGATAVALSGGDRERDASTNPTGGSSTALTTATCGDSVRAGDEECDDGNRQDGDGCNRDCRRSGGTLWEQTFQGDDPGQTKDDRGYRVAIDDEDGIIVVGEAAVADARQNIFIRAYTSEGRVRWTRQPGKAGDDEAWAVQTIDDGGVVVGGYVDNAATGRDFWLAAFDRDGGERWQYELDAQAVAPSVAGAPVVARPEPADPDARSHDEIRGLRYDAAGQILVVGKSRVGGTEDRFAAHGHVDASGLRLESWDLAASEIEGGWDTVSDVVESGAGYVLGGTRSVGGPGGPKSMWLGWFDAAGTPRWEVTIETPAGHAPGDAEIRRLRAEGDRIFAAGSLGGYEGAADAWYAAFGQRGDAQWSKIYDGPTGKRDFAHAIAIDGQGNLVVVGEAGGDPERAGAYLDDSAQVWIAKLGPNLSLLWSQLYNGPENQRDVAFDVATDSTDHIVVVGYQSVAGNGYDLWVRKLRP